MTNVLDKKKISAVICTYNRYDLLPKAIDSALNQTLPTSEYHLIVVDNSPPSDLQKKFEKNYQGTKNIHYHIEPIAGLSNARNVGAVIGNSTYTAYLDDDAIASEVWLEKIVEAFEHFGSDAGVVGGQILPLWPVPRPDWLPDSALGALSVVDWGGVKRVVEEGEWVAGANFSVRTKALQNVGGFSVELGRKGGGHILLSNEEAELAQRLEAEGFLTIYAPEATVDHLVDQRRLSRGWLRRRMAWQAISQIFQSDADVFNDLDKHWADLESLFSYIPPHLRTIRGIFEAFDDPNITEHQIGSFYSLAMLILGGFEVEKLK